MNDGGSGKSESLKARLERLQKETMEGGEKSALRERVRAERPGYVARLSEGAAAAAAEPQAPEKELSSVAQSVSVKRGPEAIRFILKNRRLKAISYHLLHEWELNEHGSVLVLEFATRNVVITGRRLGRLETRIARRRVEYVRIDDRPEFDDPVKASVTSISIRPPEAYALDEKGEYQPAKSERPNA